MDIKTISKITGLSAHTLRYYEKIGLLLNIERDSKG
jgi:DNA-binding transcriptional MerR regulator